VGANKLEKYDIEVVKRSGIHGADYNPRQISKAARKKLKKWLEKHGLWCPLIVNKRTMNLVAGHQRIEAMDAILRNQYYDITVSIIDVDESEEVAGNVFLNNPAAQGEWDIMKLGDLHEAFPSLDFEADMGFETADLDIMFGGLEEKINQEKSKETWQKDNPLPAGVFNAERQRTRKNGRDRVQTGEVDFRDQNDIQVTVVFNTSSEKKQFMQDIHTHDTDKFIKFAKVVDLYEHRLNLTIP
jgi:acylphosphatase